MPAKNPSMPRSKPLPRKPAAVLATMPSEDDIRLRAYQIWRERGCVPGREVENWLQAERELTLIGRGR